MKQPETAAAIIEAAENKLAAAKSRRSQRNNGENSEIMVIISAMAYLGRNPAKISRNGGGSYVKMSHENGVMAKISAKSKAAK